jgi:hypothetical protein
MAACADAYAGKRILLMPRTFAQLPNLLLQAVKGAGIPITHVVARIEQKRLMLSDTDDEMLESMMHNIRKAMDMVGLTCELIVNPDDRQLREILDEVDMVIGDEYIHGICNDKPVINHYAFITALDLENLCNGAEYVATHLTQYSSGRRLLINLVEYEPELFPHLATDADAIALELWQKLWQNRGR